MNRIEQVTNIRDYSTKLIELGITPVAFFWHLREHDEVKGESWDCCLLNSPEYVPGVKIPAWTKGELDVMIGSEFMKPDLYSDEEVKELSRAKEFDRDKFPVFMPDVLYETTNGASASARMLIFLLEKNHIDKNKCNERYKKFFKPC